MPRRFAPTPASRSPRRTPSTKYRRQRRQALALVPSNPTTLTVAASPVEPEVKPSRPEKPRSSNPILTLLLYLLRLGILGVGMGAIAGTVLTAFFDSSLPLSQSSQPEPEPSAPPAALARTPRVSFSQEQASLKQKLESLAEKYPKLQPAAFFVDLDNGAYVDRQGDAAIAAASTIKIPVLVAFFQDVDAGKVRLDEELTLTAGAVAGGSGDMQHQPVGRKFTALETATKTIVISDNTATNMLIERLGGKEVLNQRFQEWGLAATLLRNSLPDLEGTNTTSPKDLVALMVKIHQGELISLKSRDRLLEIMEGTKTKSLLPQGLEPEATIAHKTGDIGSVLGDAGIVDMPTGKRYVGAVLVKRPHNDYTARTLIQEISRTVYQHFKWYQPAQG